MVALGLLLLLLGLLLVLVGVLTAQSTTTGVEVLGIAVSPVALFLLGVGAAAAVLWGYSLARFGVGRAMQARREHKQLHELSEKLDRARAEERQDD